MREPPTAEVRAPGYPGVSGEHGLPVVGNDGRIAYGIEANHEATLSLLGLLFPVIYPAAGAVRRSEAAAVVIAIEELDIGHLTRRGAEHDLPVRALLVQMHLLRILRERAEGDELLQEFGRHRNGAVLRLPCPKDGEVSLHVVGSQVDSGFGSDDVVIFNLRVIGPAHLRRELSQPLHAREVAHGKRVRVARNAMEKGEVLVELAKQGPGGAVIAWHLHPLARPRERAYRRDTVPGEDGGQREYIVFVACINKKLVVIKREVELGQTLKLWRIRALNGRLFAGGVRLPFLETLAVGQVLRPDRLHLHEVGATLRGSLNHLLERLS